MRTITRSTRVALSVLSSLLAAACSNSSGGGGGSSGNPPQDESTLALTVADTPSGEITTFQVELESFRLHSQGGGTLSVLHAPARIDLSSLADFRQALALRDIEPGLYTSAEATFDFSDALCVLQGQSAPAGIHDASGNPFTGSMTFPIELGDGAFQAEAGNHRHVELDFDLDQSLVIDAAANQVELQPVLVLRVDPPGSQPFFVLGELESADAAASTFRVQSQSLSGEALDTFEFESLPFTSFHIDGEPIFGAEGGLAALAAKGAHTSVQVYGALEPGSDRLVATHVAAGSGTWMGGSAVVEGYVIGRSSGSGTSPTLTVRGQGSTAGLKTSHFNKTFTIQTNFAATKVLRWDEGKDLNLDHVNVGQLVRAYGALSGTTLDATQPDDVIRLEPTRVYGYAVLAPSGGKLSLDLERVGPWPFTDFNWSESGSTPPDPAAFQLDVKGIGAGLGISACTAVEARGHFTSLNNGGVDFDADTLGNVDSGPALLFVRNHLGAGFDLTVTASASSIQLVTSGTAVAGEEAKVDKGFVGAIALPASPTPTIEPPAAGPTAYFLCDQVLGETTLYVDFAEFSNALAKAISGGAQVTQITAVGPYDWPTNTIVSALASACVE
jgi:Domain of unknown function (DUF4382)